MGDPVEVKRIRIPTEITKVLHHYKRLIEVSVVNLRALGNLAILTKAGKPVKGEPYLREALELREKGLPAEHWLTANTRSQLGECLLAQKRYAEAEPLLRQGYEGLKKVLGEKHPRTSEAIQRLVHFFEATRKTEQAAHYRAMLLG